MAPHIEPDARFNAAARRIVLAMIGAPLALLLVACATIPPAATSPATGATATTPQSGLTLTGAHKGFTVSVTYQF